MTKRESEAVSAYETTDDDAEDDYDDRELLIL